MWNNIYSNLFFILCLGVQIYYTVKAVWRYYKVDPMKWLKNKLDEFTIQMTEVHIPAMIEREIKVHRDRLNLLSKENAKLIEENEMLRDKLKNLGFTDISLKQ